MLFQCFLTGKLTRATLKLAFRCCYFKYVVVTVDKVNQTLKSDKNNGTNMSYFWHKEVLVYNF